MEAPSEAIAERVARNEDAFRRANERITAAANELRTDAGAIPVICECPQRGCTEIALVSLEAYERVRASGRTFLVVPSHEVTVVEGVPVARRLERRETFSIMEKIGEAGELAEQLDSRGVAS